MFKILIFGGTTEGRELVQFCAKHRIYADISVTTSYGAELLPKSEYLQILIGKLDAEEIKVLLSSNNYHMVIDATHPYAVLATANIKAACAAMEIVCLRLIREESQCLFGTMVDNLDELIACLNQSDLPVLSTLGSKELPKLTEVRNFAQRLWIRILPAEGVAEFCTALGFDEGKILFGKGPFSVDENIQHIRRSGAGILVTKESGVTGGYPEKIRAAKECGIEAVTVRRPVEKGFCQAELRKMLLEKAGEIR